uniref:Rapunzel 5 n=1 Tax=Esox lucius TaxID=8010 RepID=A0A3P8ZZ40_ESOLU
PNQISIWILLLREICNQDKVEERVEIMGQASEVQTATVGQASAYIFNNQEGDEVLYLTDQFSKIKQKMNVIDANCIQIGLEQKKSSVNMRNFEREANILSQYNKFLDILNNRMKAAIDECTENFAKQAKQDMEGQIQEKPGSVDDDFTKCLLDKLVKKYDWVSWSIRVFKEKDRIFFFNWLAGKKYHGSEGGANDFDVMTSNNIKVVISFSVEPKPIDRGQIQQEIERQKLKGNMLEVAQMLRKNLPKYLVHAISHYKEVVETNNFPKECYYYEKHKEAYLCVHPE